MSGRGSPLRRPFPERFATSRPVQHDEYGVYKQIPRVRCFLGECKFSPFLRV